MPLFAAMQQASFTLAVKSVSMTAGRMIPSWTYTGPQVKSIPCFPLDVTAKAQQFVWGQELNVELEVKLRCADVEAAGWHIQQAGKAYLPFTIGTNPGDRQECQLKRFNLPGQPVTTWEVLLAREPGSKRRFYLVALKRWG